MAIKMMNAAGQVITAAVGQDELDASIKTNVTDKKGAANGIAQLDANGKLPISLFSDTIIAGQMIHLGNFGFESGRPIAYFTTDGEAALDTSAGSAELLATSGGTYGYLNSQKGYYICTGGGTFSGTAPAGGGDLTFAKGDWLTANASGWVKVDNTDEVSSVNGKTGAVTITASDISAATSTQGGYADNALQSVSFAGVTLTKTGNNGAKVATITKSNALSALGLDRIPLYKATALIAFKHVSGYDVFFSMSTVLKTNSYANMSGSTSAVDLKNIVEDFVSAPNALTASGYFLKDGNAGTVLSIGGVSGQKTVHFSDGGSLNIGEADPSVFRNVYVAATSAIS